MRHDSFLQRISLVLMGLFLRFPVWVPAIIVAAAIIWLTLVPKPFGDEEIPLFPGADKIAHFLMFGGLAGVCALDWWRTRRRSGHRLLSVRVALVWGLLASVAGGLIEIAQDCMGLGRSADWWDLFADTLGAFTGAFVALLLVRNYRR